METETLDTNPFNPPNPAESPPPPGLRPTADPTRSGALWVGGAGVALLLAAAGVLTAVRWEEIGQSVKLGGLVAITLALLAAGQRFKQSIPMTAQAIFHLGALLIPFDMAAVAILAGRTWQETLLLTSLTSVAAWYGIERAVPSKVLLWASRIAVIGLAAGVAAVSPVATALALAVAAAVAVAIRKPVEAVVWGGVAAVLPVASFVTWPPRISGAMADLGFDALDRWQPLAAGAIATLALISTSRLLPRIEVAWMAILAGVITTLVALGVFADTAVNFVLLASLFIGAELIALSARKDPLWAPIVRTLAVGAELMAGVLTVSLLTYGFAAVLLDPLVDGPSCAVSAALFAFGWLLADRRRLADDVDWLSAIVVGSDWPFTTVMFPTAILAMAMLLLAPWAVISLTAIALAFWMIATWRAGSTYAALVLVAVAGGAASFTTAWFQFALAISAAAVLMLAANLRARAGDGFASLTAALGGSVALIVGTMPAVLETETGWPMIVALVAAWAMSWIAEGRTPRKAPWLADWVGRLTASVLLLSALWLDPLVGLGLCGTAIVLAAIDYLRVRATGADEGASVLTVLTVGAGAALGLAGIPATAALGFAAPVAGAVLAVAGFVLVGIALASPRVIELPLGVAAAVVSTLGLLLAFGDADTFAIALLAGGASALFVAAALRDLLIGVAGYATVALGVALQLAVWQVDWLEPYLVLPALAALFVGYRFHRSGGHSMAAYGPTIALMAYVSIADRFAGGSGWHAVIAGAIGVLAVIAGGYRKLVGPLVIGSVVLAIVVGYESLGPAALVPTWAWLALGGTVLLAAGVAMERSDTSPLERGEQIRSVIATQFS